MKTGVQRYREYMVVLYNCSKLLNHCFTWFLHFLSSKSLIICSPVCMSICFSDSWLLVLLKLVPILPLKWIHIISHAADAGPVISALRSLQSISPLCCLHRCPRDPVLIRSLHHGDSLQHSYRTIHKNKAQTVSDTNLPRLHPTKVFPQQMH